MGRACEAGPGRGSPEPASFAAVTRGAPPSLVGSEDERGQSPDQKTSWAASCGQAGPFGGALTVTEAGPAVTLTTEPGTTQSSA
jgi:hypothetical protein